MRCPTHGCSVTSLQPSKASCRVAMVRSATCWLQRTPRGLTVSQRRPKPVRRRVQVTRSVTKAHRIAELFRIPGRYLRSVHLERDFDDIESLHHYVVTPPMVAVFSRILEGLRPGSGHRAWRITGDYGTGKSSFAL